MIPVLVADDHPYITAGVKSVLSGTRFNVVGTVTDGEETLAAIDRDNPAIVLLDINMPGMNGVETLEAMRSRGDQRPVVVLTAEIGDRELLALMRAGVNGIVLKNGDAEELVNALEAIKDGGRAIDPALLQRALDLSLRIEQAGPLERLNPRERQIARLVARGLRNREIGLELNIGEGTVKVYLHAIYQKLSIDNRTELALLAVNAPAE